MLTAGPRGQFPRWRHSRKRLSVCSVLRCPDLRLQCKKLTLHCNHISGHLKTEHTESLFLVRRHLGNWPRCPAICTSERTASSAWETWTVAAADGVRCARVKWEINFLLTFETVPFFCVQPVHQSSFYCFLRHFNLKCLTSIFLKPYSGKRGFRIHKSLEKQHKVFSVLQ